MVVLAHIEACEILEPAVWEDEAVGHLQDGHNTEFMFQVRFTLYLEYHFCCVFSSALILVYCFTGLPPSGSWQDLKDHMREAGDVCFADVFKDGTGVVEFLRYEDMKYAFKKLDDSRFRSHEVSKLSCPLGGN